MFTCLLPARVTFFSFFRTLKLNAGSPLASMLSILSDDDNYDELLYKYNLVNNVKLSRATLLFKMWEKIDSQLYILLHLYFLFFWLLLMLRINVWLL